MRFTRTLWLPLALALACAAPCLAGSISGKVVPATSDALVCLLSHKDGGEVARTDLDKGGRFAFRGIAAGAYDIEVTAEVYVTYKTTTPITVTKNSSSGDHIIGLTRGALVKGKIAPAGVVPRIELKGDKARYYAIYDPDTGFYRTEERLPSGKYYFSATAEGYAAIEKDIKLIAPKTTILDLVFVRTGSISGKISPVPAEGAVIAVNTDRRIPLESGEIHSDGSYRVEKLPPGTYDLIILAKGYERVIGWGPVPGPDTLTDKDKRDIEAIFARGDKAWADKDVDTLMALIPDKERTNAQRRKLWTERLHSVKSYYNERTFDFIVGQTGKSAVAVERVRRKLVYADDPKGAAHEDKAHLRVTLAFETGAWRITDILTLESRPEWNIPLNTRTEAFLVGPFPGEVADIQDPKPMPWRYSGDSRILSIKVESEGESRGHDFTLTPLAKP